MSASRSSTFAFRALIPLRPRYRPNFAIHSKRCLSSVKDDANQFAEAKGPNMDQLPHISEEAAATAEITGNKGPDLQQGTPIQEVRPSLQPIRVLSEFLISRSSILHLVKSLEN